MNDFYIRFVCWIFGNICCYGDVVVFFKGLKGFDEIVYIIVFFDLVCIVFVRGVD